MAKFPAKKQMDIYETTKKITKRRMLSRQRSTNSRLVNMKITFYGVRFANGTFDQFLSVSPNLHLGNHTTALMLMK